MTLSLLGPSLHDLIQQDLIKSAVAAYARSMLAAVEGFHLQGFVHDGAMPNTFNQD
jgi:hypothetical protein